MSLRLAALSLYLRLVEKPRLARIKEPSEARALFEKTAARLFRMPSDANRFSARIQGEAGDIPVEWVSRGRPHRHSVVLYLHGGAYIMGSPATHRHLAARLVGHAKARALVPAYRLAPETRWPGAVEDALLCYRTLLDTGYDARRIAFSGDSAGGGLAFATLIAARDAGLPDPACIAVFSPWLDLTLSRKSLRRNARSDPMLPVSRVAEARDSYISAAEAGAATASPLFASIPAPPPVLIQASRIELLEDESAEMAEKLREAGGDVRLEWFARAPHAMQIFCGLIPEADKALARAGRFIYSKIGAV